jgi:hypothetical protein
MRFMMIVKANKDSEAGIMPSEKDLLEMGKFNEEMMNAGMMIEGNGLEDSSKGARIHFANRKPTVENGPFPNTEELIAGYWVVKANSKEDVIDWAKRAPFVDGQIEIRRIFDLEDFPQGEAIEKEKEMMKELERRKAVAA